MQIRGKMGVGELCCSFTYLPACTKVCLSMRRVGPGGLDPSSLLLTVPRAIPIQHFLPGCYLRSCTEIQHHSWTQKQQWGSGCTSVPSCLSWFSLSTQTYSSLRRAPSHASLSIWELNIQAMLNSALSWALSVPVLCFEGWFRVIYVFL